MSDRLFRCATRAYVHAGLLTVASVLGAGAMACGGGSNDGGRADGGGTGDGGTTSQDGGIVDVGGDDPVTGTGDTYYVSPTGDDGADGRTLATAFETINHAVDVVGPGDVIEVREGTYEENVVIRNGGSDAAWILMRGYQDERPVLRGTGSGPTVYFYNSDCDEDTIGTGSGNTDCYGMYWVLEGLEIRGSASGGGDGNAVKIDTPHVRLVGNRLCCSVADVVKLVRTANDVAILSNEIWQDSAITTPATNAQAVDIVGADRAWVAGNFIHDVPDFGIYAKGNARNPVFERNLLVDIGRSDNGHALMLGQETDESRLVDGPFETYDGIVRNNVVVGSTWACVAVSSSSNARVYHNSCYGTATSGHGSLFASNESIIGQASLGVAFVNNIVVGAPGRPVVKINDDALEDFSTLSFARNLYWTTSGANPSFLYRDSSLSASAWFSTVAGETAGVDTSTIEDPGFLSTTGSDPLQVGTSSPARDTGVDSRTIVPVDRLGTARPQGGGVDVGAYEL